MAKKSIQLPEHFLITMDYVVGPDDINIVGNHLSSERLYSLAHLAEVELLRSIGYSDMTSIEGGALILAYSEIAFLAEAMLDEPIKLEVGVMNISEKKLDHVVRMTKWPSGEEVARVVNTRVFFIIETRKPGALPRAYIDGLNSQIPADTLGRSPTKRK